MLAAVSNGSSNVQPGLVFTTPGNFHTLPNLPPSNRAGLWIFVRAHSPQAPRQLRSQVPPGTFLVNKTTDTISGQDHAEKGRRTSLMTHNGRNVVPGLRGEVEIPAAMPLSDRLFDRTSAGIVGPQRLAIVAGEFLLQIRHQAGRSIQGAGRVPGIDSHTGSGGRHELRDPLSTRG